MARSGLVALSAVHGPLLAELHAQSFGTAEFAGDVWSAAAWQGILGQPGVFGFVSLDGSEHPAGFLLARRAADEAEILSLGVLEARRRQGHAAALVRRTAEEAAARGASRLFLEVAEDNRPAQALYSRLGFVRIGVRPGYYGRKGGLRVSAWILAKDLATTV